MTEATSGTDRVTVIQYSVNLSKNPDADRRDSVYRLNTTAPRKHRAAVLVIRGSFISDTSGV